jgi:ferric-dicitrate binding protein FerR (iron transport regulator)
MHAIRSRLATASLLAAVLGAAAGCYVPAPPPSGGGAQPVARLMADPPNAGVQHSGGTVAYTAGMRLYVGDRVQTPGGTVALIEFDDGNEVYLNGNTRVELGSIRLFFGEIYNLIRRIQGGGSTVYTNDLSAAAETTGFLVKKRDTAGGTVVTVVEGVVRCSPPPGASWASVSVAANFQLTAAPRTRVHRPVPVDARSQAQWVDAAARRLGRKPVLPGPVIQ